MVLYKGKIIALSKTLIKSHQAKVESLIEKPSYRAIVALDQDFVSAFGSDVKVQTPVCY